MADPARPSALVPVWTAGGLALGPAVALGFGRFAFALLLPPMRSALGWSYTQAGAMNTANGAGYLLGAVLAPRLLERLGARAAFLLSMLLTAVTIALTAASGGYTWLLLMRFLTGLGGAVTFTSGGLLAAQVASGAQARQSGTVLSVFYAGASLGILLTGLGLPPLLGGAGQSGWHAGWLALGAASLAGVLAAWWAAGRTPSASAAPGEGGRLVWAQVSPLLRSLAAYACAGLGYVAYTTFSVTYLRAGGLSTAGVSLFWALLGLAGLLAPLLWSRLLARRWGGRTMGLLMAVMGAGAALPVLSASPWVVALSALLFGSTALTVVASTTALVRQSLRPAQWGAGVALYTVTFAAFQSAGPLLTGALADGGPAGLRAGLGISALILFLGAGLAAWQPAVDSGDGGTAGP